MNFTFRYVVGFIAIIVVTIVMLSLRPIANPEYIQPDLLLQLLAISAVLWVAICMFTEAFEKGGVFAISIGILGTMFVVAAYSKNPMGNLTTLYVWTPVAIAVAVTSLHTWLDPTFEN